MDRTLSQITHLPLSKVCLWAILLCPTVAVTAGLIHPIRIWAAAGEWCQIISPSGRFQTQYGGRCEGTHVGLVRRFH